MPHHSIKSAVPIAITLSLLLGTSSHAEEALHHSNKAHEHASHQQHADHQMAELTLDHGQRWRTDAPLREGMERIRTAVVEAVGHTSAAGGLDASPGKRLADTIDESIAFMVTHCRLAPEADANLHILIGRLAEAAALAREPAESNSALSRMQVVLNTYPEYFEHPGW
jgi:hypothetical protein